MPQQERSRERFEAIVEAARRLVGERGNDAVSVREIAAEARVPVSSVYQYFPDKNAILRKLILDYLDVIRDELGTVLSKVQRVEDLSAAVDHLVDVLVDLAEREPALSTIWASVQANTVLRTYDAADARLMAEFVAAFFRPLLPQASADDVFDACLFATHAIPSTIRTAQYAPKDDADRLIREVKTLTKLRLSSLT